MSEIDRLYQYKTLLRSRRVMSRDDILQKLEISLATFKRDIAKLRDQLNTPIMFDRNLGGYRLEHSDSTEIPGMWFSQDGDAIAIRHPDHQALHPSAKAVPMCQRRAQLHAVNPAGQPRGFCHRPQRVDQRASSDF